VQLPESSFELRPETAQREVLQGESVNGDCRFSISFHADAKSAAPQMAAMVAVDPATCRAEIERGVPMVVPTDDGVRRVELDLSARAGQVEAQGANRDRKATFWTIWEDPPKAAVAKVRTSVRSVVKNRKIERALCSVNIDPLHQTGWQIDRSYFDHDCNWGSKQASSVADAHFFNDDFLGPLCSARDRTHVYVSRNMAKVTLNGTDGSVLYTWTSGGCSFLLSYVTFFEPNVFYN
jgi:hypothetical protein